ncbi:hypothetical protein I302_107420 [Kwoniella bestiolae CBS 10118]|uniref:Uncharacterized protein n=1 Tax=Kwoniella bestiolae CBS 10118 TaxID=1296100 RepID=A0A1B9FYL3_9TREE|nr:hypothetical protein I302_06838 [Kwoniella bestiolae CBS 10118]OCF23854.1 hypothetical protein I302_06838 [Kwoniella bestiolae CBS 10118]
MAISKVPSRLTLDEHHDCLDLLFNNLKPAIIKPSASVEPFKVNRIKIGQSIPIHYIQLLEFIEYARHRVGSEERLAEEEDFLEAGWFDVTQQRDCMLCEEY